MKKNTRTFALIFLSFLPLTSYAGIITCSGLDCNFDSFVSTINTIINTFLALSGFLAAGTFAYAASFILFDPANPAKRKDAKDMFLKTLKGLAIVLLSWFVIHTLIDWVVNPDFNALRFFQN